MPFLNLITSTVKTFYLVVIKVQVETTMDKFLDIRTHWFQIIFDITKVNKYLIGILNSWIALATKDRKLNVQWKKIFYSIIKHSIQLLHTIFKCYPTSV